MWTRTSLKCAAAVICIMAPSVAFAIQTVVLRAKIFSTSETAVYQRALGASTTRGQFEELRKDNPGSDLQPIPSIATHVSCDRDFVLVVRAFNAADDTPATFGSAGITSFSYAIKGEAPVAVPITTADQGQQFVQLAISRREARFGQDFCTKTQHSDAATLDFGVLGSFSIRRAKTWDTYGWNVDGHGVLGAWVPVGIFAVKFPPERTADGYVLAALPVNLALGGRRWVSSDFYFGISGLASYAIAGTNPSSPPPSGDETIVVSGLGLGGLLDINSLVYLTASYQWSFKAGEPNPGFMIGIGPGAGLVNAIATGRLR